MICEKCYGKGWLIARRDNLDEWLLDPEKGPVKDVVCYACGGSGEVRPAKNLMRKGGVKHLFS